MKSFLGMMKTQYNTKVKVIECDGELFSRRRAVREFLESKYIKIEPSAPNTQAQNGGAERSGGVVKEKMRVMRTSAKLPQSLWPEIGRTTVYLNNRSSTIRRDDLFPRSRFAVLPGVPAVIDSVFFLSPFDTMASPRKMARQLQYEVQGAWAR
jgi:hypothetical protein